MKPECLFSTKLHLRCNGTQVFSETVSQSSCRRNSCEFCYRHIKIPLQWESVNSVFYSIESNVLLGKSHKVPSNKIITVISCKFSSFHHLSVAQSHFHSNQERRCGCRLALHSSMSPLLGFVRKKESLTI